MASKGIETSSLTWQTVEAWAMKEILDARNALEASDDDSNTNRGRIQCARDLLELGGVNHVAEIEAIDYHG